MSGFTKIHCRISSGVVLRIFEQSHGPLGVVSTFPKDTVTLKGGDNNVDSDFYASWIEANPGNELIQHCLIERIN